MATTSFARKPASESATEVESHVTHTEVSTGPTETTLVQEGFYDGPQIEGEITQRDVRLPRINVVQKTGELGEIFPFGTILFSKEVILSDGDEKNPVKIIILRGKKQYQEKVPFGGDEQARVFDKLSEVRENGGTIDYELAQEDRNIKLFQEMAHFKVLIECPADVDPDQFIYEFEGKNYTLAAWTIKGSAYNSAGKAIITAAQTHLKDGLHHGAWNLHTVTKKFNGNTWKNPVVRSAGKNSPEFIAWCAKLV